MKRMMAGIRSTISILTITIEGISSRDGQKTRDEEEKKKKRLETLSVYLFYLSMYVREWHFLLSLTFTINTRLLYSFHFVYLSHAYTQTSIHINTSYAVILVLFDNVSSFGLFLLTN
jgi:hypothetical protein